MQTRRLSSNKISAGNLAPQAASLTDVEQRTDTVGSESVGTKRKVSGVSKQVFLSKEAELLPPVRLNRVSL